MMTRLLITFNAKASPNSFELAQKILRGRGRKFRLDRI